MINLKKYVKPVLIFVIILVVYFIPGLIFRAQPEYYIQLKKPFYAPPALLFGIMWPLLFVLFSVLLTKKILQNSLKVDQVLYFVINYFLTFFFNKLFFIDHNLLFTLIDTALCFISGLLLFICIYKEDKKEAFILLPYLLWTAFASILMANIYFIN